MKRAMMAFLMSAVLLWTILLNIYHMGVLPPPQVPLGAEGSAEFISRDLAGLNHLILKGSPYARGLHAGRLTKHILKQQEEILISQLRAWIPQTWMLQMGIAGAITYFYGADQFISSDDLLEMYGTSKSAPQDYDFLADGYTRQLAYHGLHEVGQMMVDRGVDMGCTVAAVPHQGGWILGRNFDFEGGRVFDSEKLLKWVFPDQGLAHVSVIWAGMVGAVTGVNEKGLYISINAAGSEGFRRVGTPSTLVVYKVLREARTVDEAIAILREAHVFISDIFVVMDSSGRLVRVEKSPQKFDVLEAAAPFVVANHLVGSIFAGDATNDMRKIELTSVARESRGLSLTGKIPPDASAEQKTLKILEVLRDKGVDELNRPLHLGHRQAIDAMIATHSVIMDSTRGRLYVGQGPSVAGKFLGYDLAKSFHDQKPVLVETLPADPMISESFYSEFKQAGHQISTANRLRKDNKCGDALIILASLPEAGKNQGPYFHTLGDVHSCLHDKDKAHAAWRKAYEMRPAYAKWHRDLENKLAKDQEMQ